MIILIIKLYILQTATSTSLVFRILTRIHEFYWLTALHSESAWAVVELYYSSWLYTRSSKPPSEPTTVQRISISTIPFPIPDTSQNVRIRIARVLRRSCKP